MVKTYKLWLDDIRQPPDDSWVVAKSYDEALQIIAKKGFPTEVSLDHDLGFNIPTGYDFVKWLVDQDINNNILPEDFIWFIHSANPCGAENMHSYLARYFDYKRNEKKD